MEDSNSREEGSTSKGGSFSVLKGAPKSLRPNTQGAT